MTGISSTLIVCCLVRSGDLMLCSFFHQCFLPIFAFCINNCTFSDITELYACILSLIQRFDNTKSGCWWSAHKVCKSFHDEWHQSFQLTETCHITLAIINFKMCICINTLNLEQMRCVQQSECS